MTRRAMGAQRPACALAVADSRAPLRHLPGGASRSAGVQAHDTGCPGYGAALVQVGVPHQRAPLLLVVPVRQPQPDAVHLDGVLYGVGRMVRDQGFGLRVKGVGFRVR